MSARDFHDAKLELMERAKQSRPLARVAAKAWVKDAMRRIRSAYPGVQWGDFPGRVLEAVVKP